MIKILEIPGTGIGPIVTKQGVRIVEEILKSQKISYAVDHLDFTNDEYLGSDNKKTKELLEQCENYNYLLFGAIGVANKKDNNYGGGLILDLRKHFQLYINLRPAKQFARQFNPLKSETPFDMVIVRENTECAYINVGGRFFINQTSEVAVQEMIYTSDKTAKAIRFALDLARKRKKKVTLCDKSNVLKYGHGLWKDLFYDIAQDYPDITIDHFYVDALVAQLIKTPQSFDVIVAPNMFGDIISDLAGQLQGGIATAGSISFGDQGPALVEPVHGSADDLEDKNYANPIGMINSISLMFDRMGMPNISAGIVHVLEYLMTSGIATPDLGGTLTAQKFTDEFLGLLRSKI